MSSCSEENLLRADGLFTAIVEDDFSFVFGDEVRTPVDVFDFVIGKVLFIDTVEASDIGISLVFEGRPVKRGSFLDGEAIGFGVVDCFCYCGGVPGYFLRDTAFSLLAIITTGIEFVHTPH